MKRAAWFLLILLLLLGAFAGCGTSTLPTAPSTEATEKTTESAAAGTTQAETAPTTVELTEEETEPESSTEIRIETEPDYAEGQIFLYGEIHADAYCLEKELAFWGGFYARGSRHLFIESEYFSAAYLNLWMQADNDDILEMLFKDNVGTNAHSTKVMDFYRAIKERYPETVFHGTDIGHKYATTGARYLRYLEEAGLKDSEEYQRTETIQQQGKTFYEKLTDREATKYRENCMVENFIWTYEQLPANETIMGIYGGGHTDREGTNSAGTEDTLAKQLAAYYGDRLHIRDLYLRDPIRIDQMQINGKTYTATYFGCYETENARAKIQRIDFWRLEDAYEDFASIPATDDFENSREFPFEVTAGQVIVAENTLRNTTVERIYYRADGDVKNGKTIVWIIKLDEPSD